MNEYEKLTEAVLNFNKSIEEHGERTGNHLHKAEELSRLACEAGREISEKVLRDFPEFPKDVVYCLGQEREDPKSFFRIFSATYAHKSDFNEKMETHYTDASIFLDEFIRKTISEGLFQGYNEIWEENFDNEVRFDTDKRSEWTSKASLPVCSLPVC